MHRLVLRLATLAVGVVLAAAEPAPVPLAELRVADGRRLVQHWNASLFGTAWQHPTVAPLRARLDQRIPELVARIGFDPLTALTTCTNLQAEFTGIDDGPDCISLVRLQVDLGTEAVAIFNAIARRGRTVATAGSDRAVEMGDGRHALRVTLCQGRWLTAGPAASVDTKFQPAVAANGADVEVDIDGPRLADLIATPTQQSPEVGALLRRVLPHISVRTEVVTEGFASQLALSGTWSWLRPIDTTLWARLPAEVDNLTAVAIDGPALWRELVAPTLAEAGHGRSDYNPDEILNEFDLAMTWEQLANGLSGTWMLAQSLGHPQPTYTLIIPRSTVIDQMVSALVKRGGSELPSEGQPCQVRLPKGMPTLLSLARDQGHWVASTDLAFAGIWLAPVEKGRWTSTPLGRLAIEKSGKDACLVSALDTVVYIRAAIKQFNSMTVANKMEADREQQAIVCLLNRLAELTTPGWTVMRLGPQGLEGNSLNLPSCIFPVTSFCTNLMIPALTMVRNNSPTSQSASNLRTLAINLLACCNDRDQVFPPNLATMMKECSVLPAAILHSPGDPSRTDAYLYVRPAHNRVNNQPLIVEDPSIWKNKGCMVAFCDGHVAWYGGVQAKRIWAEAQRLAALPAAAQDGIRPIDWAAVKADLDHPVPR